MMGQVIDLIPDSPKYQHKNRTTDSKENYM